MTDILGGLQLADLESSRPIPTSNLRVGKQRAGCNVWLGAEEAQLTFFLPSRLMLTSQ